MKTNLPNRITTVEEAKAFLTELHKNDESFHPEDNAHDIEWETSNPTSEERDKLNALMSDIYELEGNEDSQNMIFDPCEFLLNLINQD